MEKTARFRRISQAYKTIRGGVGRHKRNIKRVGMGLGFAGAGAGLGAGAYNLGRRSGGKGKKSSTEYVDKSKSRIRWFTFPGGPILVGPTMQMKQLFAEGKRNRMSGLKMLAKLLKAKTITKTGKVPMSGR